MAFQKLKWTSTSSQQQSDNQSSTATEKPNVTLAQKSTSDSKSRSNQVGLSTKPSGSSISNLDIVDYALPFLKEKPVMQAMSDAGMYQQMLNQDWNQKIRLIMTALSKSDYKGAKDYLNKYYHSVEKDFTFFYLSLCFLIGQLSQLQKGSQQFNQTLSKANDSLRQTYANSKTNKYDGQIATLVKILRCIENGNTQYSFVASGGNQQSINHSTTSNFSPRGKKSLNELLDECVKQRKSENTSYGKEDYVIVDWNRMALIFNSYAHKSFSTSDFKHISEYWGKTGFIRHWDVYWSLRALTKIQLLDLIMSCAHNENLNPDDVHDTDIDWDSLLASIKFIYGPEMKKWQLTVKDKNKLLSLNGIAEIIQQKISEVPLLQL